MDTGGKECHALQLELEEFGRFFSSPSSSGRRPVLTFAQCRRVCVQRKFDGYVTSDCDAVGDVYTHEPAGHGYASPVNGTALSLKAGTDMDCGGQCNSHAPPSAN